MRNSSTADARPDAESEAAQAKAAFHLRMRARGIQDRDVLRAFELVPRHVFVPPRHRDLAGRDVPLPIDCGQTMPDPGLVARMIEALRVERTHRVLEIGAGTGYATTVLAVLAKEVVSFERFRSLADTSARLLADLGVANATIAWADGLAARCDAPFDRIVVHGVLADPGDLLDRLESDGVLVCARPGPSRWPHIVRVTNDGVETIVGACRLQPMMRGCAAVL